ncbi:2-amino-4-hydroxy-6-hydroxymethyldihydropteridine diphosphokinase [Vibrio europaeus]|uniref:2-amino-4-hydroxy-6-hydroxymethyldihydropteridine diphosphokinase n=1 Tax=Vibrio europaeus TaxID=300876 RepID=A0A178JCQ1_9VIBR|nr:2-amino-4-hydroxy-6-hydroxymethyldihydropteridine diphosphokinase [Vibrio europaeus]MDC5704198.1 2-amino-4-hydroxy-6-hydroxymethyldihydropteridine diphosphokinase [Vibrio europaeus]MDC5708021.1 2-amino-4-hydroxy-6-hydroxymethyldihydropteridine diphosphokinase [Vibrio europaeus]MDC5714534.1 2-amino-4-hydroxy-6-hydroxymethyldihydropteridine diphosphokinase [Vibrio europaeus]MDC5718414.1 2-amino-4-hydroxy-6-hydroxymethyldihydropteridine diphosphokinase [Vibrio europaeus]MDC5725119.1 2-amino-4-
MITTYIGIGSNIDRRKHIQAAIIELGTLGCDIRLSTIYECESIGFESHAFYNLVVEMKTSLTLTEFSRQLRKIELKWGRAENAGKFEPRTVDLDIILFGDQTCSSKPEIPRGDIFKYAFVLKPLFELCPQLVVPHDGRTIEQIWQQTSFDTELEAIPLWFN